MIQLSDREWHVIALILDRNREQVGEDFSGLLVYNGAFSVLTERELLDLAAKIERAVPPPAKQAPE